MLQALAALTYTLVHSGPALYATALVFGVTVGNVYMLQALVTGEVFGMVSFASIYGVVALSGSMGSAAGLFFTGWAVDRFDGYAVPFRVLAAANAIAAGVVWFAQRPLTE